MKTKFTWIAGLAMLLAGCSSENLESNNAGNDSGSFTTKQSHDNFIWAEANGTVTFGIKCIDAVTFHWGDGSADDIISASPNMQYVSHTFPAGSTWGPYIFNARAITEFECKNSGIELLHFWTEMSQFMELKKIDCSNNSKLTALSLDGGFPFIQEIICNNNSLSLLGLTETYQGKFYSLTAINCNNNDLAYLDCSPAPNLVRLLAGKNNISNIKLDGCNKLTLVDLWQNNLSFIDFSNALQLNANPTLLLGNNPFENTSTACASVAQTLGVASNGGNIALDSGMAVQWFEPISKPKGWEVFVLYDYNP